MPAQHGRDYLRDFLLTQKKTREPLKLDKPLPQVVITGSIGKHAEDANEGSDRLVFSL